MVSGEQCMGRIPRSPMHARSLWLGDRCSKQTSAFQNKPGAGKAAFADSRITTLKSRMLYRTKGINGPSAGVPPIGLGSINHPTKGIQPLDPDHNKNTVNYHRS